MIDIEKWKNRIENELTLSKDLCLNEMRLNFTRNDLIELNVLLGVVSEIRNKAIEEFAERLITNAESFQAEVNGFRADLMTHDYFIEFVDEIAESMKGEKE